MLGEVVKLVGMEMRDYTGQDGRPRQFCGLHLVYAVDSVRSVRGNKVEQVSCPRGVDPALLDLGKSYQLDYETFDTKDGKKARLVDLLPVEA